MLKYEDYRKHCEQIFRAALEAADPWSSVKRFLQREGSALRIAGAGYDVGKGRVFLISVGKAALPMADAAYEILGNMLYSAGVISKRGGVALEKSPLGDHARARLMTGSHPVSGEDSVRATADLIHQLKETTADDLVLFLISGGASALLTQPDVSLPDWQLLINALLASGCTINEFNTVRRQLDSVKGGGLARLAAPARCVSLILSDVVGNPLQAIGSGPTVILEESPDQALAVLDRYNIASTVGDPAYGRITDALLRKTEAEEHVPLINDIYIIGDVKKAAEAAMAKALELGFDARIATVELEGEAREVGRMSAQLAKESQPGQCIIFGGETTVTLRGDGLGGRNLETALSAAIALAGWPKVALASVATDGEDGPTPAAGAAVSGWTAPVAEREGLPPQEFLENNDSYSFFKELDKHTGAAAGLDRRYPPCLVLTGSTGTNVNDLIFILTYE